MNDPLRRFIVWSLAVFALLATGAAVLGTSQAWALRQRAPGSSSVSRAEVVSMQPHVSAAPVILVMGPSGSEVKVRGTQHLRPPYPLEGDYMEVVFLRSGGAVVPATAQADQAASGTVLIVGVWLAWGAAIAGGLLGARYLLDTRRPWWPRVPRRSTTGRQDVCKTRSASDLVRGMVAGELVRGLIGSVGEGWGCTRGAQG
jgi:hypothetical protein